MNRTVQIIIGLLIIAGIVGIIYAATSNKDTNNTSTTTQTNQQNSSGNNTPSTPANTSSEISIMNLSFSPSNTTVKKGTQVTWTNNDSTAHTVTADSGTGPSSGTLQPGGKYSFTFNDVGTFKYHCSIHPDMTGSVTVTE